MARALVLNATDQPLAVVPARRAVVLVLKEKAEMLASVDHVIPRSRGGTHTWDNVVAACRRCNSKKENRLHTEVGFRLARLPFAPSDTFRLALGRPEPEWEPYLA